AHRPRRNHVRQLPQRKGHPMNPLILLAAALSGYFPAADEAAVDVKTAVERPILEGSQPLTETIAALEPRVRRMPEVKTQKEWEREAAALRKGVLEKVVFRGEAAAWRDAKPKVEWLETIDGGPGYKIKKLRYEAVPGLWVPALLYEPEKL